jgi:3-oxoacyl-[acyl-carrier-protein] synthase II
MDDRLRVVVTGIGVVAPNGIGKETFWRNSLSGECFIRPISRFDAGRYACRVAGQVEGFGSQDYIERKVVKQTDRSTHMAIACCRMAAQDACLHLENEDPHEIGMYFANSFGGMEFAEPELYAQRFLGPERVSAYQAIAWFYAATQGQWSIGAGIKGFGKSLVADRAGGLQALALAALAICRGHCRMAFVGGFDAPLSPYAFLIHQTSGLLSTRNDDPAHCYRPFDVKCSGMVLGEGSGILLLEELHHALDRQAPIYAEVAGWAVSCDSYHWSAPAPDGEQLARCLRDAIDSAGLCPEEIDHLTADGAATPLADRTEAIAISTVFTSAGSRPTVSAPKSIIGHTLAAAGALDAIWTCLMIQESVLLPTLNLDNPDPHFQINHLRGAPAHRRINAAVCCNRGYGGLNTAVVLRRYEA